MNRNSICKYTFVFFSFVALQTFAQQTSFKFFSRYASKVYDVKYKKPKGFIDLDIKTVEALYLGETNTVSLHSSVFRSRDNNCIVMYPYAFFFNLYNFSFSTKATINSEIERMLGLVDDDVQRKNDIDFNKYVKVLTDKDARKYFNADSVFVADMPIREPYKEIYKYCIGLYVCKRDRPKLFFKIFLTEKGKEEEDKYLKKLYKRVWYRNDNWVYDKELDQKMNLKLFLENESE